MDSQIYDSGSVTKEPDDVLEKADNLIAELGRQRAEIAARRRALVAPSHKVVVANPTAMHHKITLGGVLVNEGFQAADADALAGLLRIDATEFARRFVSAASARPNAPAGEIIAHLIDLDARDLAGLGLFTEWQRRLNVYLEDRAEWLARDDKHRLHGAWRNAAMTADQRWLLRVTCRVLRMAMPGHLLRGQAADWLEEHGANLNYGDFA
jgi:hypothetical protein